MKVQSKVQARALEVLTEALSEEPLLRGKGDTLLGLAVEVEVQAGGVLLAQHEMEVAGGNGVTRSGHLATGSSE